MITQFNGKIVSLAKKTKQKMSAMLNNQNKHQQSVFIIN